MHKYEIHSLLSVPLDNILILGNKSSLKLYNNNLLLHENVDYIILEDGSIQLLFSINRDNDILSIEHTVETNKPIISNGIDTSKGIFPKLNSSSLLSMNTQYNIKLNIKGKEFNNSFMSKLSPLYLSNPLPIIRQELGSLISNKSDKDIILSVHDSSKSFDDLLSLNETDMNEDYSSVRQSWVRYKTCIDLITTAYLSMSGDSGSYRKKAGNIEIEKQIKVPYLDDMLDKYNKLFGKADSDIHSYIIGISAFSSFVKGGNNAYPLNSRLW